MHGEVSNPFLTGSSVHNQRIERLWRDTFRCVIAPFYQLFYFLEDRGLLDPLSETDLYCLHLIYLPMINSALDAFHDGWNSHAITTEHSLTPLQIITTASMIEGTPATANTEVPRIVDDDLQEINRVDVPDVRVPLSYQEQMQLQTILREETEEMDDYRIDVYKVVREYVHSRVHA